VIIAQIPLGSSRHVLMRQDTFNASGARRDEHVEPSCSTRSPQRKCIYF